MGVEIHLLGPPAIVVDGERQPAPRGRKPWALLAYLICAEGSHPRERLAGLLFANANDPLGALRWNLAELRRLLGAELLPPAEVPAVALPPDALVDVEVLRERPGGEALALPGFGRELVEGMSFDASPEFDAWLLLERRHLGGIMQSVLHDAIVARLAAGEPARAIELSTRLVALDPLEENFHELLVRSYARAGDQAGARRALRACEEIFRRELAAEPTVAVARAAAETARGEPAPELGGTQSARALLETGESSVAAGAVDAGLECLRQAAGAAERRGDRVLTAEALLALGRALVHSVRGRDQEGATALRRGAILAAEEGEAELAAIGYFELGYIEVLRGRYDRAPRLLDRGAEEAGEGSMELAAIESIRGMAAHDAGRYAEAEAHLRRSVELASITGDRRREAFSASMLGRLELLRDDLAAARAVLERALELAREENWLGFIPWPEALLAEVDLHVDRHDSARERFEHAFALGCQIGDPCWEGIAQRGLGLLSAAEDPPLAIERLQDARERVVRAPDAYAWVALYALDALCGVALEHDDRRARGWIEELRLQASRRGMRELVVRSYLHEAAAGDEQAARTAVSLAAEVDNPALERRCATAAS